jgi:hypothetical protein
MLYALKGTVPQTIAKRSTPKLQISAANPWYPPSDMISGAI